MLPYLLYASSVAESLVPHGLQEHKAALFPAALLCSAPYKYERLGHDIFLSKKKNRDDEISKEEAEDLLGDRGEITEIFNKFNKAVIDFDDEFIFAGRPKERDDGHL